MWKGQLGAFAVPGGVQQTVVMGTSQFVVQRRISHVDLLVYAEASSIAFPDHSGDSGQG